MSTLTHAILSAAQRLPEGGMISPKLFLHLASRAAVDQALTRLAREGKILRVKRGTYVLPISGRFGTRAPSTESIIQALENQSGETIVPNGAATANALGLTTQVPIREVFITSGVSRRFQLGNRIVELRHGSREQLAFGKRPAGMAIRALLWLGAEHSDEALHVLRKKLPPSEWEAMRNACATFPSWMARAVSAASLHE